jgi:SAM-dependent methyltransferase
MDLTEVPEGDFQRHPWEVVRARFFGRLCREIAASDGPRSILDVGAGDGYFAGALLPVLPPGSSVVCFDANYLDEDLQRYAARSAGGISFVRQQPAGRFDILLFLDVLEHIEDDHDFLTEVVQRNLAPGGTVVVSVPAWQLLFGRHDVDLLHHRRYSPAACRALLTAAGLSVERSGGLFHSLLLARLGAVIGERAARRLGREPKPQPSLAGWRGAGVLSSLIERALFVDNAITRALGHRGWSLPGLSFWAVCRGSESMPVGPRP